MHQVVWAASGGGSSSGTGGGGRAMPPHSWMSSPRWRRYHVRSASASRALKKMPPIPVTRCMASLLAFAAMVTRRARQRESAPAADHHGAGDLVVPALLAGVEGD